MFQGQLSSSYSLFGLLTSRVLFKCTKVDVIQQTDSCKVNLAKLSGSGYDSSLSEAGWLFVL